MTIFFRFSLFLSLFFVQFTVISCSRNLMFILCARAAAGDVVCCLFSTSLGQNEWMNAMNIKRFSLSRPHTRLDNFQTVYICVPVRQFPWNHLKAKSNLPQPHTSEANRAQTRVFFMKCRKNVVQLERRFRLNVELSLTTPPPSSQSRHLFTRTRRTYSRVFAWIFMNNISRERDEWARKTWNKKKTAKYKLFFSPNSSQQFMSKFSPVQTSCCEHSIMFDQFSFVPLSGRIDGCLQSLSSVVEQKIEFRQCRGRTEQSKEEKKENRLFHYPVNRKERKLPLWANHVFSVLTKKRLCFSGARRESEIEQAMMEGERERLCAVDTSSSSRVTNSR